LTINIEAGSQNERPQLKLLLFNYDGIGDKKDASILTLSTD